MARKHYGESGNGDEGDTAVAEKEGKAGEAPEQLANRVLTVNTSSGASGVLNAAVGQWTADAGTTGVAMTFTCGFKPRYVRFINLTDLITDEWYEGMAADSSLHTVSAGTLTNPSSGGITVSDRGFSIAAGLIPASKSGLWFAHG